MSSPKIALIALAAAMALLLAACGTKETQVALRTAVDAKQKELSTCYAASLKRNRNTSGDVVLWITVSDKNGTVSEVEVDRTEIADKDLQACIGQQLKGITLDKAPPHNVKVEYTLTFKPKD
ncbi:MAG: AgmX/PglI C-terminal domain-containing protein [Myxococcales bacterium]|nr:AgmX/PglI C-terminal domain-containing protein [Myxococcales bacterium]